MDFEKDLNELEIIQIAATTEAIQNAYYGLDAINNDVDLLSEDIRLNNLIKTGVDKLINLTS